MRPLALTNMGEAECSGYAQHQYPELFIPETGFPENAEHGWLAG